MIEDTVERRNPYSQEALRGRVRGARYPEDSYFLPPADQIIDTRGAVLFSIFDR